MNCCVCVCFLLLQLFYKITIKTSSICQLRCEQQARENRIRGYCRYSYMYMKSGKKNTIIITRIVTLDNYYNNTATTTSTQQRKRKLLLLLLLQYIKNEKSI